MKQRLLLLLVSLCSLQGYAQNNALSEALLDEFREKQNPVTLKSTHTVDHHQHLWMTPFLKRVVSHWDELTQEAKDVFEVYTTPPTFSGDELIYTSGKFKFHYTLNSSDTGENVASADVDANNTPDYVEDMAAAFGVVQNKYHTQMGLVTPVYTEGYYHIYINGSEAGDGVYGYVTTEPESIVGDNPNSPDVVEMDAAESFMVMRNNYDGFGDPEKAYKVTAAHEYMHAIQYGIDWEIETWFAEACAVWGEEYVFPGYDDNFQYLTAVFSTPDMALNVDDSEGEEYEGHWYGTFLFVQYLVEQTDSEIVKKIYTELIGDLQDESMTIEAIDKVLEANSDYLFSDFNDVFSSYALANTIISEDEMFSPFVYKRANDYYGYLVTDDVNLYYDEGVLDYTGTDLSFNSNRDGNGTLMRLSYDPFMLYSDQNFKVSLSSVGQVDMVLVKISATEAQLVVSDENYEINVVDNGQWLLYYLTVIRWDGQETNALSSDYTLNITQATTALNDRPLNSLVLSPNPVDNFFTFATEEPVVELSILDVSGRWIGTRMPNAFNEYDVADLSSGAYLVRITLQERVIIQKLIVE